MTDETPTTSSPSAPKRGAVHIELPLHPPTKLGREDVEILMDGQKVTVESTVSLVPGQKQIVRDYLIYPRIEDNARYIQERDVAEESVDENALPPGHYTHNRTEIIYGEGSEP